MVLHTQARRDWMGLVEREEHVGLGRGKGQDLENTRHGDVREEQRMVSERVPTAEGR